MASTGANKDKNSGKRDGAEKSISDGERSVSVASERALFSAYDAVFQQAAEGLVGTSTIKTALIGSGTGTCQELRRQWDSLPWKNKQDALQTFFFQSASEERMLVVAPTSTLRLLLDAFLGLDVERLSSDRRVWSKLHEASGQSSDLTELERDVLSEEAFRLGVFNPRWFDKAVAEGRAAPLWKTRFLERDLQKGVDYLGNGTLYWEIRRFELAGLRFGWAILFDAAALSTVSDSQRRSEPETIVLPDFEKEDAPVTMFVRIASGTIAESDWLSLRPGDVLTTEEPADRLFDAIVDNKVIFRVRPGLFHGQPAVQIKEAFQ